jgi:hypothetical protein
MTIALWAVIGLLWAVAVVLIAAVGHLSRELYTVIGQVAALQQLGSAVAAVDSRLEAKVNTLADEVGGDVGSLQRRVSRLEVLR